jgi:CBS domain containing-hemolysin-like protein
MKAGAIMADESGPKGEDRTARRSSLTSVLSALGLKTRGGRGAAADGGGSGAAANLRSQAEAFQTITVGDVMTPRADITAVELSASFETVVATFAESEHSRLPVYKDTLDDPVGVAHIRDVFRLLARPDGGAQVSATKSDEPVLARLKRPTLYVPPSMRVADLLVSMQSSRMHMAMVIDEFGGVDGVVTLEDVIEAVVGEIDDEHDTASAIPIAERAGGVFEADGRTPLEVLETALGRPLSDPDLEEDIETAAGLVTALAGRVPQRGEVIAHPGGLEFEITDADPRRVKRLRIRPTTPIVP